ncbi:beta-mannosidase isoform X1 [Rhinichthys klamathensis goyatoka]|uniref:beta-mannosidase isoform X1 n=1 Tax=Rhinichthys klamathensis goyatoka TaxID=3034132 RepID=UPI0024B5BAEA|nr:beta-mannosidase isoform X1 [Rhinichthys klamathensis goyatoka]
MNHAVWSFACFYLLEALFLDSTFASEVKSPSVGIDSISLNGKWQLLNSNSSVSLSAEVPGCVHTALQRQGFISDPYYRFNDLAYRWISLDNWTYTTSFSVPTHVRQKEKAVLVFEGVDTISTISLNGVTIGKTDNMFRRYDFDVTGLLKDQENILQVWIMSAVTYASQKSHAHTEYRVPPDCPPPVQKGECHVNFIRKAQSSFSWDWGPSFPTLGIWKGVQLEVFNTLRVLSFTTVPKYDTAHSSWNVEVELFFDVVVASKGLVLLSIPLLHSEEFQLSLTPGQSRKSFVFQVNQSVSLWWPFGHGEQPLYDLKMVINLEGGETFNAQRKVAFRTVELIQEPIPSSPGLSFYFRINGKPIFLKGSNWIPVHAFQDQVTTDMITILLQSAQKANMNALRVWGGGVYEQGIFYSLCDMYGIMIWQDFMFACALYPTEKDFIQTVREEVTQQVRRLKSHPSVVIWSGNNENEAAIATDWFNIPVAERPLYVKDYVKLYVENIRDIVLQEDSTRPFLVSSPTNGVESEKEGWVAQDPYDPHYGDTHYYSYYNDCWDWTAFPRTRFASEYGFQSWPSLSTLRKVSVSSDWDFSSNFSSHRQHHEDGNQQMLKQAELHYILPNSTDPVQKYRDTIYITQVMQAQCVKIQTEFYRRSRSDIVEGKGHTMGTLYWQLNDIWQGPSWSSVEFGGKWKMLHYWATDFYAPILSMGVEDKGDLLMYAVSDSHSEQHDVKAKVKLYSWSSFDAVCSLESNVTTIKAGGSTLVFQHPISALLTQCGNCTRRSCIVTFHLSSPEGQMISPHNHIFLSSPRHAEGLQKPNITFTVKDAGIMQNFVVTLYCSFPAVYVWLDVDDIPGDFNVNGFLMLSKNSTVTFGAWRPTTAKEITANLHITSLRDVY